MWGQKPFNSLHWVRKSLRDGFWTIHGFYFPFLSIQHLALISLGRIVHCQILLLCTLKPCYPPLSLSDVVPHQMQILVGSLKPFHQEGGCPVLVPEQRPQSCSLAMLGKYHTYPRKRTMGQELASFFPGIVSLQDNVPSAAFLFFLNHESDIKMFFPALVWK